MRMIEQKQIKAIWASARENGLDKQSVYDVIYGVSGKEHMTELSYIEAAQVLGRIRGQQMFPASQQKRTDQGGDPATVALRRKIYALTGELGWNDDNNRINGFAKKMLNVDRIEWLSEKQCHILIEALKGMIARPFKAAK